LSLFFRLFAGHVPGFNSGQAKLARERDFPYLMGMEVHFTPEQEAQLAQLATKAGTDAEHLVRDVVLRLFQEESTAHRPAPELPVLHLGRMKPLNRRDIYDDVR
jgi:hypothetical protein